MRHVGTAVAVIGIAGGAILTIYGALRLEQAGLSLVIAGSAVLCASVMSLVLMRLVLKIESNTSRLYNETRELHEALTGHSQLLQKIVDNTSISEAAKSIAHRGQERDALRGAIFEEVRREDFDAAFHLIDDLESRLGYREDADRLRV